MRDLERKATMNALLYLLTILASIAVAEFLVLRRCFGRWSLATCIFGVAISGGVFWTVLSWLLARFGSKVEAVTKGVMNGSDYIAAGFFFVVWVLILSSIALIPAGLTAMIYKRFRNQP